MRGFHGCLESAHAVMKGLSLRDISDTLFQFYNLRVHFDTIRRWITKYTQIMDNYTKDFKPELSDKWHIDEQMIKSKKDYIWCWNVLDSETRFLIANNVTRGREITDRELRPALLS